MTVSSGINREDPERGERAETWAMTQHRKGDMPVRKPDVGERQQLKTKKKQFGGNLWNQWKKYS